MKHYPVNELSDQWAAVLENKYTGIDDIGAGNGLSGIGIFFLYRYWNKGEERSRAIFLEILETILVKMEKRYNKGLSVIELTEFLHLLDISETVAGKYYDTRELKDNLLQVVKQCGASLLDKEEYDPYTGGFFQAWYLLQSGREEEFTRRCIALLRQKTAYVSSSSGYFHSLFHKEKMCLSITHGLAFYITYLCTAYEQGIDKKNCLELLACYSRYLFSQRLPFAERACFFTDYEGDTGSSRLSLCYGDAGILVSLLRASRILNDTKMEHSVLAMLQATLNRTSMENTGVQDDSLLYGRAGLYLFYNKVYQLTGQRQYAEASISWKQTSTASLTQAAQYYRQATGSVARLRQDISFQEGLTGTLTAYNCSSRKQLQDLQFFFYLK